MRLKSVQNVHLLDIYNELDNFDTIFKC